MKKILLLFFFLLTTHTVCGVEYIRERVTNYHSHIQIYNDGKMRVAEHISFHVTRESIKRGFVRSIPYYYKTVDGEKKVMKISIISVTRNGKPEEYGKSIVGHNRVTNTEIRIGDKDVLLDTGAQHYIIVYETEGQIDHYHDFDELYWNVTGNDWNFRMDTVSATIVLPHGAKTIKTACYEGKAGSTKPGHIAAVDSLIHFNASKELKRNEGLTIAVSFTPDIIQRPQPPTGLALWWSLYKLEMAMIGSILLLAIYYLLTWKKRGQRPPLPTVVPTYTPPHDWSPSVTRFLNKKEEDSKLFTTTLISMAVKGALIIKNTKNEYTLERGREIRFLSKEERVVFNTLFNNRDQIAVSDTNRGIFLLASKALVKSLKGQWKMNSLFQFNRVLTALGLLLTVVSILFYICVSIPMYDAMSYIMLTFVGLGFGLMLVPFALHKIGAIVYFATGAFFTYIVTELMLELSQLFNIISIIYLIILFAGFTIYSFFIKTYTPQGAQILSDLEGFKMYMKIAEEHRLDMLTPPERTPELFEKLLPYAFALDLENAWSEKFDDVLQAANYNPDWYSSSRPFAFRSSSLTSFSRSFSSSISSASASRSSGSGGRGSSGGGRGGGGGRGW